MAREFYRCNVCENLVGLIHKGGGQLICCGEPMEILKANTTEAAQEKHVPVFELKGDKLHVKIGDVPHPMTPEHWIQWIMVTQDGHTQRTELTPDDAPEATFIIDGKKPFVVCEYCNLHRLWKASSK